MRIVIIMREPSVLKEIMFYLDKFGADVIGAYASSDEGYDAVMTEKPDAVFMGVDLPVISGIDLGVKIRNSRPRIVIVYVSEHPELAFESFKAYPLDYMLTPIDEVRFETTIGIIGRMIRDAQKDISNIPMIKCFGNFNVRVNDENMKFQTKKVREMLVFMLCHYDKPVFKNDVLDSLFQSGDERKDSINFRVTLFRLRHAFKDAGIIKQYFLINENCTIIVAPGVCDFIDFLEFIQRNKIINGTNINKAQKIIETIDGEPFSDIDTHWITDVREVFIAQIENLLLKAAQFYMSTGSDKEKAELVLIRLIDINNLSETGYEMLMDIYIRASDNDKFLLLYKRYSKIMKTELHSEPQKKYTKYYLNIKQ